MMSNRKNVKVWGILAMLLLVLPALALLPAGSAEETRMTLKVTVIDEVVDPILGASVRATNVHSNEAHELYWDETKGHYSAVVVPGTYEIHASASNYIANMIVVEQFGEDNEDSVFPVMLRMMSNEAKLNVHVMVDGEEMEGASVHVFAAGGFHKTAVSQINGWANFTGPEDDVHILVMADDKLTYSAVVMLNSSSTTTHVADLMAQPSGKDGSYRVLGFVKDGSKYIPGIRVHVWDITSVGGHMVPFNGEMDGSISLPLYPSVFRLLIEADGYEPYWEPSIDLTGAPHYWPTSGTGFELTPVDMMGSRVTTIDLSGEAGIASPTIMTVWTLDANSRVYGFDNDFGTPRMQVSGMFYSSDWTSVDPTEAQAVEDAIVSWGPAWKMTKDFLLVNGEDYTAEGDLEVSVDGFEGSVFDAENPVVTSTQAYGGDVEFESGDNLRIEILKVLEGETIVVKVPTDYEILGDYGDMAEFPYMNRTDMILVKSPLEISAKKEKEPTSRLTFTNSFDFYRAEDKTYVVALNKNVTLSGRSSTDVVGKVKTYVWFFPTTDLKVIKGNLTGTEDEEADQITVQFTKNSAAYHNVTLKVIDTSGIESVEDFILIKPDGAKPKIDAGYTIKEAGKNTTLSEFAIDEDIELEFNASSATDNSVITNYIWTFGDGSAPVTGKVVKHRYPDPGSYNISLKLIDAVGNEELLENTTVMAVEDITEPMAVINPFTKEPKMNEEVTLNASQSYDARTTGNIKDLASYTWTFKDPLDDSKNYTLTGKVVAFTFENPGDYILNLTVTDGTGLKGWTTRDLRVRGADLEIRNVQFTKPEIGKIREKEKAKGRITIANNGAINTSYSSGFTVKVIEGVDRVVFEKKVDVVIDAGDTYELNFTYRPRSSGAKDLKFIVDSDDDVKEENEDQNEFALKVTVKEQKPIIQWWWFLIALAILLVVYVVFMRVTRNEWGYEVILDWWNKRKKD